MEYRLLGSSGVKVSQLCFGTMSFGGDADEETSAALFQRCRDEGVVACVNNGLEKTCTAAAGVPNADELCGNGVDDDGCSNTCQIAAVCGNSIVETGEAELSLYVKHNSGYPTIHVRRYTLRPDGFVSVHGPYAGGEMITRPLIFSGNQLTINYATSAAGSMWCELQDENGTPIPGLVPIPTNAMPPMPDANATIVASDLNNDGTMDSSQFDANGDGIADIFQAAVAADFVLLGLEQRGENLEDIFRQLTTGAAGATPR